MTLSNSTSLEVVTLMQICRDIETYCAEIYHVYAERFGDDEELRELWSKTFAEEENHARQFVLAISMRREGAVVSLNLDKVRALQVLEMVKSIYSSTLAHLPSKLDALRAAINLEKKLAEFHLAVIAEFQDESLKQLFQAMMLADNQHLQAIENLYRKRLKTDES